MTNTPFSKKCEILANANADLSEIAEFCDLAAEYDLGFAYAHGIVYNHITLHDNAKYIIDETWQAFCDLFGVDYHGDYDSLEEIVEIANEQG